MSAGDRVSATMTCPYCDWSVRHTADDVIAVARFLRQLGIAHYEAHHAPTSQPAPATEKKEEA